MIKVGDIYKANAAAGTLMLSNFTGDQDADFWKEYRDNHTNYDRVFNRMFNSFFPFMQDYDENLSDVANNFRNDVYDHLLMNKKKYEELFRVQVIPDDDYSLINNYDMQEIMDKDVADNQDNIYGQRQDSGSFTKGSRSDSSSTTIGQQSNTIGQQENTIGQQSNTTGQQENTKTDKVAPYDSSTFANNGQTIDSLGSRSDTIGSRSDTIGSRSDTIGSRSDSSSFTEGSQSDSSTNTKGSQTDDLNRTYTEDYTLHRVGNIGVQTVSDMLGKHIRLWSMWEFYEYIFKEICKDLLLL